MRKKAKFLKFLILTIFLCITTSTAFADTTGELIEQWAADAMATSSINYQGAKMATGPSTGFNYWYHLCYMKDSTYAHGWVPKNDTNSTQWIRLIYNQPVYPTKVDIYETHKTYDGEINVSKVYFVTISGRKVLAWEGNDNQEFITWKLTDADKRDYPNRHYCAGIIELTKEEFTEDAQNLTEPVEEILIEFQTHKDSRTVLDAVKLIGYKWNEETSEGHLIKEWPSSAGGYDYQIADIIGPPNGEVYTNKVVNLIYKKPLVPFGIKIYEGRFLKVGDVQFVKKVYFYTTSGRKVLAWEGDNSSIEWSKRDILKIFRNDFTSEAKNLEEPINKISIYLDYSGYDYSDYYNYIGIDTVELIGFPKNIEEQQPIVITEENSPPLPDLSVSGLNNSYYEGQSPKKINLSVDFNNENSTFYVIQKAKYKDITDSCYRSELHYTLNQPMQIKKMEINEVEKRGRYTGITRQIYFVTTSGQKILAWDRDNSILYSDSQYHYHDWLSSTIFYHSLILFNNEFTTEAKELIDVKEIIFKLEYTWCYQHPDVNIIGYIKNNKVTLNIKNGGEALLNKQLEFNSSQSVDIAIPDEIKNQIAYNPGIYTVEAIVGFGDNKKVVTKNFTVKAVNPSLALDAPDTVNILESSSVNINVNASVNPAESGYTLSQITYSIPELDITDQPVENGKITIDNIDHPVAEVYHVTIKGCINELEDRCSEVSKTIRFTAPTPEIELSCPSSIYQGNSITCQLSLVSQDYTPEQLQIEWMIDGQEQENATDTTSLDYTFNDTGNHYIKAIAKYKNAPFIQDEKTAGINVISTQIDINSLTCGFVSDWSNFWTQEHICPFDTAGDNGEIKLNVIANFNDLTPKIKIVDADTGDVLKDIAIESTDFKIKPEDLNFAHILQTKNLNIIAYYEEMPDKKVEKNISVISAPSIPEFDVTIDDSKLGQAPVQVAIKNYNPDIYGPNSNWKAGLTTLLSGQIDTVDYTLFNISGKASLNYSYNKEGQLTITPKVALFYNGNPIKVFNLPSQTITAKLAKPIEVNLRSSSNWKGYAPFSTTVVAYSSLSTWQRTKGLEWILDNQTIAGGPDDVVKNVTLTIEQPGNHILVVKGYHTDSEQIDIAGNATFEILSTPEDVTNAFELKVYYNRDKTITVATGRVYKANELVTTPVRERLQTFDWKIKDSSGNIIKSGQSNITRWNIDFSDLDLNKDYSIEVDWHTSIGRNFIAEADVDESMIKTHGIDFSKADLRVFKLNSRRHDVYLGGISSTLMKITNMQTHFEIYDSNGNKITEGNATKISFDPSQIEGQEYTAKCNVKDPDGKVVWQKTLNVALDNTSSSSKNNNNQNNSTTSNNTDDSDIAQLFANRIGLSCMVMDPFVKRVRCVVDKIYYGLFLKRHGYTVNYCVSTSDSDEICGKSIIYYTFQTGGEKTVTLNFTYSKNNQSQTITRNATVVLPSSLEELLSDPEKGLYGDVKIVDPIHNTIKAEANIKDRYYRNAFFRLYTLHLKLVDNNGNTIFEPKLGRTTFYYEMPPSETDSYTLKIDVVPKNDPQNVVYSTDTNFNIETLTQNMADLKIKPMNGRNTPWGVYMFTVNINPTSLVKYLGWSMILKNEQNENISELKRFSRKVLKLPDPGAYTVEFKAYSKDNPDNVFLTKTYTIEASNEKPQVNIDNLDTLLDYRGKHILLVDITPVDSDGRIKSISVTACNSTKRYTRSVFNCGENQSADVNIKVCDDAGECTELTRHVQWDLTSANN